MNDVALTITTALALLLVMVIAAMIMGFALWSRFQQDRIRRMRDSALSGQPTLDALPTPPLLPSLPGPDASAHGRIFWGDDVPDITFGDPLDDNNVPLPSDRPIPVEQAGWPRSIEDARIIQGQTDPYEEMHCPITNERVYEGMTGVVRCSCGVLYSREGWETVRRDGCPYCGRH